MHVSWIRVSFLARAKISTSASSPRGRAETILPLRDRWIDIPRVRSYHIISVSLSFNTLSSQVKVNLPLHHYNEPNEELSYSSLAIEVSSRDEPRLSSTFDTSITTRFELWFSLKKRDAHKSYPKLYDIAEATQTTRPSK